MSRSNYVRGDFSLGKVMLKEKTGDVLLIPIVVTTSDVQDFDFSIPIFKSWYAILSYRPASLLLSTHCPHMPTNNYFIVCTSSHVGTLYTHIRMYSPVLYVCVCVCLVNRTVYYTYVPYPPTRLYLKFAWKERDLWYTIRVLNLHVRTCASFAGLVM